MEEEKLYEILQRIEAKLDARELWTLEQEKYAYYLYKEELGWFDIGDKFNGYFGTNRSAMAIKTRLSMLGLLKISREPIDKLGERSSPLGTIYSDPPF